MAQRDTLYEAVKRQREEERVSYQRVMLTGYFNEEEVKRESINV